MSVPIGGKRMYLWRAIDRRVRPLMEASRGDAMSTFRTILAVFFALVLQAHPVNALAAACCQAGGACENDRGLPCTGTVYPDRACSDVQAC
jgi:hypothetical protein